MNTRKFFLPGAFAPLRVLEMSISLLFLLGIFMPACSAMEMKLVGKQLLMSGGVVDSDYVQFKEMLRLHGDVIDTLVLGNSPGGDGWAGLTIGEMVRERGLRTVVSGACRSACAIIFMGGGERHFADEKSAKQPRLGFHGTYRNSDKSLDWGQTYKRKRWIVQQTAEKIDEALLERWLTIERSKGYVYFFGPGRQKRADGVSVLYCDGTQTNKSDLFEQCEKVAGKDAYTMGIVTSTATIVVNKANDSVANTVPESAPVVASSRASEETPRAITESSVQRGSE